MLYAVSCKGFSPKGFSPKTLKKVSPLLKAPKLVKHAKRFIPRFTNLGAFSGGETFFATFSEKS
jgi:hypothetical protein